MYTIVSIDDYPHAFSNFSLDTSKSSWESAMKLCVYLLNRRDDVSVITFIDSQPGSCNHDDLFDERIHCWKSVIVFCGFGFLFFICHFSSKIEYFCIFFYFHDEVKKDRNFILYNDHYLYFNYWSLLILWKMNFVSSILEWMSFNVELKSNKSRMFELIKVKKRKFKN